MSCLDGGKRLLLGAVLLTLCGTLLHIWNVTTQVEVPFASWRMTAKVQKQQHWPILGRESLLASIPYLNVDDLGRERALLHVLMTLMSYPMEVDIILVSNTGVKAAEGLVWRQALRPQPFCNKTFQHGFCLCWEALHALREAALTGDVEMSGPGVADTARTDKIGASQSKQLAYDYYVYMEADLLLPAASFYFFARHADTLFHRGYKLKAHRREPGGPSGARMADMRPHLFNCEYSTLFDESANASYLDQRDRVYITSVGDDYCLYASSLLLSRRMFQRFLTLREWDWDHRPNQEPWAITEAIDPSLQRSWVPVTHERMQALHLMPLHNDGLQHLSFTHAEVDQLILGTFWKQVFVSQCFSP
ncbi:unnamed protein product, partial [Durusdinium trenchii]